MPLYLKLALGNVRRGARDYSVYFATLGFAACLLYSFVASTDHLRVMGLSPEQLGVLGSAGDILQAFSVFTVLVFLFLVRYANRFLLRRAQARVRPLRAVRHGARCGIGRARGRDGARGCRRTGVRFGSGCGTVARVRRGRGLRVRRSLAARVLLLARLRGMDRRMLCRGVRGERGGRRARYRAAPADRSSCPPSARRSACTSAAGRAGRPGGARRGPARGRMGLVRVPTGVLHRAHHPHGLRRLLRHVARRAPGRGRMG